MTINVFGGGNSSAPVFPVQRSVRLRSSASAYFNRTMGTPTTQNTWTYSAWVKRGALSTFQNLLSDANKSLNTQFLFDNTNSLSFYYNTSYVFTTSALYRDSSAWYHVVLSVNSSASGTNKVNVYVNGSQVTSFSTDNRSSFSTSLINTSGSTNLIGAYGNIPENFFDGYLTEVNFIDGQALTPTSFGSINSSTGVWQPIKYSGTYGTNGFYLNFQDNSGATATTIGKDSSGNGNNWTPNNISVTAGVTYDSMLDVPTLTSGSNANFCTLNPIGYGANANRLAISNGNLAFSDSSSSNYSATATFAPTSGKWYCEMVSSSTGVYAIGLLDKTTNSESFYRNNGTYSSSFGGSGTTGYSSWTSGDVISIAWDVDAGKIWFAKNGTWQSGSPSAGTSPTNTFTVGLGLSPDVYTDNSAGTKSGTWNFGAGSGFSYTPPTGFKSLNTYNLPDSTIPSGATQFAATTYTGTGSSLAISNTVNGKSFQPDLVWVKGRSGATDHALYDSVRGTTKQLESNATAAETTEATGLTAFGSSGFTVGALAQMNTNAATYVGWQWKAGGAAVTNTSGSISSQVSANPSAGFSIVTYTGTGVAATVGHGLNIAPRMIIVKTRTGTAREWVVGHSSLSGGWNDFILLSNTAAKQTGITAWNNTAPTSSVFSLGTGAGVNESTILHVAYCFSEIAGFSKFGSYTGNGSADGPFVYLGFRPRWVMVKSTGVNGWVILDTSRSTFNLALAQLIPNLANAEDTTNDYFRCDILSNGFKLRTTGTPSNANGVSYIYAAFAESPFKNALAR